MDSVFQDLYTKYHQDVFQFLVYMVKSKEQAEDLVQEVYIRVLKSYKKFQGKSSEKTWLFSIARNVAIDHFRKEKGWKGRLMEKFDWGSQQLKDDLPLPEDITLQKEELRQLFECLDACSTDQRLVIVMRYMNELSITETADALNWTESKVKTTQHRAIKTLKDLMNDKSRKGGESNEKVRMG
ncbi:RNA polymerase sigma factor SigX [Falsibacillus pallidus]|uniref:RNA polymerase sigma factor n=1 Tax=Falsibacillus pallidus TaxID=493781 RepID=A0A370GBW1_9BACI|nr:RNA polymerase sigma factor SigX [Falsibacillus pallidus]RDI41295.1 RNA polymerase sigma (SigX) subunit [Falsibacillus pallidus]